MATRRPPSPPVEVPGPVAAWLECLAEETVELLLERRRRVRAPIVEEHAPGLDPVVEAGERPGAGSVAHGSTTPLPSHTWNGSSRRARRQVARRFRASINAYSSSGAVRTNVIPPRVCTSSRISIFCLP
jgi:hypothetical protein